MKFTLLDMVQEILGAMQSEEVNSIDDTTEAYDVAKLIRSVYYDLAIELSLPEHEGLFELNASGDPDKPTLMTVPETVSLLRSVRYNNQATGDENSRYEDVAFMPFDAFYEMQRGYINQEDAEVGELAFTSNGETFEVMYKSDKHPQWFTTIDDHTLIFDSYDAAEDTTLQKSKTMCMGVILPTFSLVDSFTPDLDPTQFSLLKNRAKVRAFAEFKQLNNAEAIKETRNQKIKTQKNKWLVQGEHPLKKIDRRFGRRGFGGQVSLERRQKQGW